MKKLDLVIRAIEIYFIVEILLSVLAIERIWEAAYFLNCGIINPTQWGCFVQAGGFEHIVRIVALVILGLVLDYAHHKQESENKVVTREG